MSSFDDETLEFRRGYRAALVDMEAEAHTLKGREPAASSQRLVAEIEALRMMLLRLREVTEQVDQAIESVEDTRQHATEMLAAAIYASPEPPVLLGQLRERQEDSKEEAKAEPDFHKACDYYEVIDACYENDDEQPVPWCVSSTVTVGGAWAMDEEDAACIWAEKFWHEYECPEEMNAIVTRSDGRKWRVTVSVEQVPSFSAWGTQEIVVRKNGDT